MDRRESEWDPSQHESVEDRMAQFAEVREKCPVAFSASRGGHWTIARYKDVVDVASKPAIFSNGGDPRFGRRLPPLEVDPPEHAVFRQTLQKFWLPSRMRKIEPSIVASTRSLLAPLLERGYGDLAREFAYPLPVMALCAQLDISTEHWAEIKALGEQQLAVESDNPEEREAALVAHRKLVDHARAIVRDRHANPRDPQEDITSALLAIRLDGQPIDDELVAGVLRLLISAGHNSTTNALGNTLLYLARNQDAQDLLRKEPERIGASIEELLRYESPVQEMLRFATENTEFGGRSIEAGDRVGLLFGSANRDEAVFPEADKCILDRKPNRHLAFGHGIHMCLGAPMARLELRTAVTEILLRTRKFEIAGDVIRKPFHHMGVRQLPVRFL